jgi:hypothetical protein
VGCLRNEKRVADDDDFADRVRKLPLRQGATEVCECRANRSGTLDAMVGPAKKHVDELLRLSPDERSAGPPSAV